MKCKTGKIQKLVDFLRTLPITGYPPCHRRNGQPSVGWEYGIYALSVAIKHTKLPYEAFWSGQAPTPSTQYPRDIVVACREVGLL